MRLSTVPRVRRLRARYVNIPLSESGFAGLWGAKFPRRHGAPALGGNGRIPCNHPRFLPIRSRESANPADCERHAVKSRRAKMRREGGCQIPIRNDAPCPRRGLIPSRCLCRSSATLSVRSSAALGARRLLPCDRRVRRPLGAPVPSVPSCARRLRPCARRRPLVARRFPLVARRLPLCARRRPLGARQFPLVARRGLAACLSTFERVSP